MFAWKVMSKTIPIIFTAVAKVYTELLTNKLAFVIAFNLFNFSWKHGCLHDDFFNCLFVGCFWHCHFVLVLSFWQKTYWQYTNWQKIFWQKIEKNENIILFDKKKHFLIITLLSKLGNKII